jgi:hypothetical protein
MTHRAAEADIVPFVEHRRRRLEPPILDRDLHIGIPPNVFIDHLAEEFNNLLGFRLN